MAIGRVYLGGSTMHIIVMNDDFTKVVVRDVGDVSVAIPVPRTEVKLVRESLGTFIACPTHLIKAISKNY